MTPPIRVGLTCSTEGRWTAQMYGTGTTVRARSSTGELCPVSWRDRRVAEAQLVALLGGPIRVVNVLDLSVVPARRSPA